MERIDFTGSSSHLKNDKSKKIDRKYRSRGTGFPGAAESAETDFSNLLFSAAAESVSLEELLDDVHTAGEKLIEKPFISSIRDYREAVGRFIGFVVRNAYAAESEIQNRRYMKNGIPVVDEKKWTKIKIIDEKLEKLALYILQSQKGQLTILKKIEEIEGILIDLMR